jgi:hypothetical protein
LAGRRKTSQQILAELEAEEGRPLTGDFGIGAAGVEPQKPDVRPVGDTVEGAAHA